MGVLSQKYERLRKIIKSYGSLLVAYSGGVDSTFLLKVASDVLGDSVLAVTASSAVHHRTELDFARRMARRLGVRHRVIKSDELADKRFIKNPPARCYWCKLRLLKMLGAIASRERIAHVAVGSHMDDLADYRPGERAVRERGMVSPLRLSRFTKDDVRHLSRRLGLPGWRREAMACLASRIPYGEAVDEKKLERIAHAETFIRGRGFRNVRVRHLRDGARIEVAGAQLGRFLNARVRNEIVRKLKAMGFISVSVDLEGYRPGSLNRGLVRGRQRKDRTPARRG